MISPTPDDCPWCGWTAQWVWEPGPGMVAIAWSFHGCAATGPIRKNIFEATLAWNGPVGRPLPAPPISGNTANETGGNDANQERPD